MELEIRFAYAHYFAVNETQPHLVRRVFSPSGVQYIIDPSFADGVFSDLVAMSRAICLILLSDAPNEYSNPDDPKSYITREQLPEGFTHLPLGLPAPMVTDLEENFVRFRGTFTGLVDVWNQVQEIASDAFIFLTKLRDKYKESKAETWERILDYRSLAEEFYLILPRFDPIKLSTTDRILQSPEMSLQLMEHPFDRPSVALHDLIEVYDTPIHINDVVSAFATLAIDHGVRSELSSPHLSTISLPSSEECHYFLPPFFEDDDSTRPYSPTSPFFTPRSPSSTITDFFNEPATVGDIVESHSAFAQLLQQFKDELVAQGLVISTRFTEDDDVSSTVTNHSLNTVDLPAFFDPRLHHVVILDEDDLAAYERDPGSTYRVSTPFPIATASGRQFNVDNEGFIFTSPRFV